MSPAPATFEMRGDRDLVITRSFNAPRRLVFDCFTKPEHVPNWMIGPDGWTMPICEVDLRVGGAWRFVYEKPGHPGMTLSGSYIEVSPPAGLVAHERWGPEWPITVNTLDLTEAGGVTTVVQTVTYPSAEARAAAMQTGMSAGMEMSFRRLEAHLATLVP